LFFDGITLKFNELDRKLNNSSHILFQKKQQEEMADSKPIAFTITPESVHNREVSLSFHRLGSKLLFLQRLSQLPKFTVTGKLDSSACLLSKPLTGEVTIHKCDIPIKSIELQLLRAETCGSAQADSANTGKRVVSNTKTMFE
jgi:hypothetical protein